MNWWKIGISGMKEPVIIIMEVPKSKKRRDRGIMRSPAKTKTRERSPLDTREVFCPATENLQVGFFCG